MTSINNVSANKAVLFSLRQISNDLTTSQNRIASGYKVASAKDNASIWATAQSLRSDIKSQDAIDSGITIAKAQIDTATQVLSSMQTILTDLAKAAGEAVDYDATNAGTIATTNAKNAAVQVKVDRYQEQLMALAKSATFQGKNLVTGAVAINAKIGTDGANDITLDFTSSAVLGVNGTTGILGTGTAGAFTSVYATTFASTSTTTVLRDTYISTVNAANASITQFMSDLGSYADTLASQQDFSTKLTDIRNSVLSSLVDANMEDEAAKVQALQVKQQLAYQALSIGNSASQNLLRLFQ